MDHPIDLCNRTDEIRRLVASLTPIPDMAILMDVTERALRDAIDDLSSPVSQAYRRARAEVALRMRTDAISAAAAGSERAAEAVAEYYNDMLRAE